MNEEPLPIGIALNEACPDLVASLISRLSNAGHSELADQLPKVLVVSQALAGNEDKFSFMAYPVPRLTFEERQTIPIKERDSIDLRLLDGSVVIDLDGYGRINWFHVSNLPNIYKALRAFRKFIGP